VAEGETCGHYFFALNLANELAVHKTYQLEEPLLLEQVHKETCIIIVV
jgi:hypothetical protein